MTRKLWSLSGLSTELGHDRRTLAKAMDGVPQDGTLTGGHKAWYLKTALDALKVGAVEAALAEDEAGRVPREEADRRRAVALAIVAEVEADQVLGQVVARSDAEADMAAFCMVLKTGLANAAAKIAARGAVMTNPPEIQEFCEAELNRAFDAAQGELVARWVNGSDGSADDRGEDQSPQEG